MEKIFCVDSLGIQMGQSTDSELYMDSNLELIS